MSDAEHPNLFALPTHGGDLAGAEARFGRPALGWLDLSTGINPQGYPVPPIAAEYWRRLPDGQMLAALRGAAARCYAVADPALVVPTAGSQAAIQALPRLFAPAKVQIVGPTYGEHAAGWHAAGHTVVHCPAPTLEDGVKAMVVVNPNNPDGRTHDPAVLRALGQRLARRGGVLVVDEAFGDLCPELSLAAHVGPGLVVLRSVGKFFGLGGIRLGFALCDPGLGERLRALLGPWSVSGPAVAAGVAALWDDAWITATRAHLTEQASALDAVLAESSLTVTGGTALFRLVSAPRAWALYEHLGAHGILVRPFAHSPRLLRFGLPADAAERDRLAQALGAWNAAD